MDSVRACVWGCAVRRETRAVKMKEILQNPTDTELCDGVFWNSGDVLKIVICVC